jgi:hypothetical protein
MSSQDHSVSLTLEQASLIVESPQFDYLESHRRLFESLLLSEFVGGEFVASTLGTGIGVRFHRTPTLSTLNYDCRSTVSE